MGSLDLELLSCNLLRHKRPGGSSPTQHNMNESLAVWCSEHNIKVRGGYRLSGAAIRDRSIIDMADSFAPAVCRLLQHKPYEMDKHWASDYLLVDGHTVIVDVVYFATNRGKIKAVLRQLLAHFKAAPIPR
jgi:hypothetical protein